MGWGAIIPAAGALLGAIGGEKQRRDAKKAAAAANAPKPYHEDRTQTTLPGLGVDAALRDTVNDIVNRYKNQQTAFRGGRRPPRFKGGPSSSNYNLGPSSLTKDLVGELADKAREGDPTVKAGQDFIQGHLGSQFEPNYMLKGAYDRASGKGPVADYYDQFIGSIMPGVSGGPPGGTGGGSVGSGAGSVGSVAGSGRLRMPEYDRPTWGGPEGQQGDYSNPELQAYMSKVLKGEFLDEGNPHIAAMVDRMRQLSGDEAEQRVADLTRREAGAGRYGRGRYGTERGLVEDRIHDALTGNIANLLGSTYQFERGQMGDTANLMSSRDLAKWQDATNRYGIDVGSATSRYGADVGSAASRYGADAGLMGTKYSADTSRAIANASNALSRQNLSDSIAAQERMHNKDTILSALSGYGGQDLARSELMSALGQSYGGMQQDFINSQLGAVSQIPGLTDADYAGYDRATDASFKLDSLINEAERAKMAGDHRRAEAAYRDAMRQFEYTQNAPDQFLDDKLRRLLAIGGTFPTTTTNVKGVSPGGNVVPPSGGGAIQGGIGGLMAGLGALGQFGGGKRKGSNRIQS